MPNQSPEAPRFPATCARCGGRVPEPVSFCPHCGTHARLAFGREAVRPAPATMGPEAPFADALWESRPTPLLASRWTHPAGDIRPPLTESSRQWGIKGGTALALLAFVVLFGGVALLHRHDDASTQMHEVIQRTAAGSVQPGVAAAEHHDVGEGLARLHGGVGAATQATEPGPGSLTEAQLSAPPNASPDQAASAGQWTQSAQSVQSAQDEKPAAPAPSIASNASAASDPTELPGVPRDDLGHSPRTRTPAASVVAPSPGRIEGQPSISVPRSGRETRIRTPSAAIQPLPDETRGDRRPVRAARFVAAAQVSLARNNLAASHQAIAAALAAQPGNGEAFMLQQDLHSREAARDAALSAARVCVVQQQWNCAWHHAGKALSIDSSSAEAKALVDRAIVESGAAARPPGPGPDGPDVPMLTR
jgi:hypothetical protein